MNNLRIFLSICFVFCFTTSVSASGNIFGKSIPVISYGQSVSVGGGSFASPDAHGPENPSLSQYIYSVNTGKTDFVTLASLGDKSHDQGMLEVVVNNFLNEYGYSPKFLSLRSGSPGRSIEELSVRPEHIFYSGSLSEAANIVPTEYTFALYNGSSYDIYIDDGTLSPEISVADKVEPTHYANMLLDFFIAMQISQEKGEELSDTVMFNWTQGQANREEILYGYETHLARIIDMLEADLSLIYGAPVRLVSMINQVSQYSFYSASDQLSLIANRADVHFGHPEYTFNIQYPQGSAQSDNIEAVSHLNSLGYRLMGEKMGYTLYDILTAGYSSAPHVSGYSYDVTDSRLTLEIGGLQGNLIEDASLLNKTYLPSQTLTGFIQDVQSYYPYQHSHAGLSTGSGSVEISSYNIVNGNTLEIDIENPENNDFTLSLGEDLAGHISTAFRDSLEYDIMTPTQNYGDTSAHKIHSYLFLQQLDIDALDSSFQTLAFQTNTTPYFEIIDPAFLDSDGDTILDVDEIEGCTLDPDINCGITTETGNTILFTTGDKILGLSTDGYSTDGFILEIDDFSPDTSASSMILGTTWKTYFAILSGGRSRIRIYDENNVKVSDVAGEYKFTHDTPVDVRWEVGRDNYKLYIDGVLEADRSFTPVGEMILPTNINGVTSTRDIFSGNFSLKSYIYRDSLGSDIFNQQDDVVSWNSLLTQGSVETSEIILDQDSDGILDTLDNCESIPNPDQLNTDGDTYGNVCDEDDDGDSILDIDETLGCELDPDPSCGVVLDQDNDGILDTLDNCETIPNPDQLNTDGDAYGNVCDNDDDGDSILDIDETLGCELDPDPSCGVVLDQDGNIRLVISYGQSLSVGGGGDQAPDINTVPKYPDNILALGSLVRPAIGAGIGVYSVGSSADFQPMREVNTTHVTSMLNTYYERLLESELTPPKLLGVHAGSGGRSIFELLIRNEDIYNSLGEAMAAVTPGTPFAVHDGNNTYSYYYHDGTQANLRKTRSGHPNYFENIVRQLIDTKNITDSSGESIDNTINFVWIQGQADTTTGSDIYDYQYFLEMMVDQIEEEAELVFQRDMDIKVVTNQIVTHDTGGKQLQAVIDNENFYIGAQETWLTVVHPAIRGGDHTHLSHAGYTIMGEILGNQLADIELGNPRAPLLMTNHQIVDRTLRVDITGLRGVLTEDTALYTDSPYSYDDLPPHMGLSFRQADGYTFGSDRPNILTSRIVDEDTLEVSFDRDIDRDYRFYIGQDRSGWSLTDPISARGGTTLRDSVSPDIRTFIDPVEHNTVNQKAHTFIPHQYVMVGTGNIVASFSGETISSFSDQDNDTIPDAVDNCVTIANTDQLNTDGDAYGNVCDDDDDGDSILDIDETLGCELDSDPNCGVVVGTGSTNTGPTSSGTIISFSVGDKILGLSTLGFDTNGFTLEIEDFTPDTSRNTMIIGNGWKTYFAILSGGRSRIRIFDENNIKVSDKIGEYIFEDSVPVDIRWEVGVDNYKLYIDGNLEVERPFGPVGEIILPKNINGVTTTKDVFSGNFSLKNYIYRDILGLDILNQDGDASSWNSILTQGSVE